MLYIFSIYAVYLLCTKAVYFTRCRLQIREYAMTYLVHNRPDVLGVPK